MNLVPMCLCTFFGLPIAPFRTATDIFATPTSRIAASRAFGISWIFLGTYARSAIFFWQTHRIGGDISTMESRYVVGAKNRSAEYSLRPSARDHARVRIFGTKARCSFRTSNVRQSIQTHSKRQTNIQKSHRHPKREVGNPVKTRFSRVRSKHGSAPSADSARGIGEGCPR